ncbi:MAG: glycosyltransferase family 9 protein, partial [candidate division FCPU426 bacterium]
MDPQLTPKKILIVAPNWVGDSIFMLPALSALKRRFSEASFTLLARSGIVALHRASPVFDDFVALDSWGSLARFKTCWGLRPRGFDLCVVFPNSFSWGLAAFLSGAKHRLGRGGQARGFLFDLKDLPLADRKRPVWDEYLDLARLAGAEALPTDKEPLLALSPASIEEKDRLFREAGLEPGAPRVALCPTSAYGPSKVWPLEKFSALARELKSRGYRPYVLCAPAELPLVEALGRGPEGLKIL